MVERSDRVLQVELAAVVINVFAGAYRAVYPKKDIGLSRDRSGALDMSQLVSVHV